MSSLVEGLASFNKALLQYLAVPQQGGASSDEAGEQPGGARKRRSNTPKGWRKLSGAIQP